MTAGRTYVLIFFFWAVITIITPTLIHLSAAAKSPNLLSHTKVEESIKASGLIITNYLERNVLSRRAPIDRKPAPQMASATILAPTHAPAPAPVEGGASAI